MPKLPTFPQGGAVTAQDGVGGIPPENFQQALRDVGVDLIESGKRPEDAPAVQAAIDGEVDNLQSQLGHGQPPEAQPAPAPAQQQVPPDTPQAQPQGGEPVQVPPTGPQPPQGQGLADRIGNVLSKYGNDPEELAKAYLHTDKARVQSQQKRAEEISALKAELADVRNQMTQRYAPVPPQPQAPVYQAPTQPVPDGNIPEDSEEFFKDFRGNMTKLVNGVVTQNLQAYDHANKVQNEQAEFNRLQQERQQEIQQLKPIMDEIYYRDRDVYESMQPTRAMNLLIERARDRAEAARGRQFFEEIQGAYGQNGTPEPNAAPKQTGALPTGGQPSRRQGQQPAATNDWSNTQNFNRLWKTRSDSVDEMKTLTDILEERGFGEDVPIY